MKLMDRIHDAEFNVSLAGSRAAGFLGVMLQYGLIPSNHRKHAEEILNAHHSAQATLDSILGVNRTTTTSREGEVDPEREIEAGDIVRPNAAFHASHPGEQPADMQGEVRETWGRASALVRWDSGMSQIFNRDFLERVPA